MSSTEYNSSESESDEDAIRDINEEAQDIISNLLPAKSSERYKICYNEFMQWRNKNKLETFSEETFLVYFKELSKTKKPSTLWSCWSMLRSVMNINHNININCYQRLKALMKMQSKGYQPKKAKIFTWNEIKKFIDQAPDEIYLAVKVSIIHPFRYQIFPIYKYL